MNKALLLVNITAILIGVSYGMHGPILPVFAKNVIGATYAELGVIGLEWLIFSRYLVSDSYRHSGGIKFLAHQIAIIQLKGSIKQHFVGFLQNKRRSKR